MSVSYSRIQELPLLPGFCQSAQMDCFYPFRIGRKTTSEIGISYAGRRCNRIMAWRDGAMKLYSSNVARHMRALYDSLSEKDRRRYGNMLNIEQLDEISSFSRYQWAETVLKEMHPQLSTDLVI